MGGKGNVWYMRGLAGHPADTDRDIGFKNALAEYPDIKVAPEPRRRVHRLGPGDGAPQLTNDFIASGQYDKIQGIWASGMDTQIVDAIKAAGKQFVPIVGADIGGFVTQLLDPTDYPGLEGAAVTNTAAVGGAGVNLALKLLNGETVTTDRAGARRPNTVLLDPVVADNTDRRGQGPAQGLAVGPGHGPALAARPPDRRLDRPTTRTGPVACKGPR